MQRRSFLKGAVAMAAGTSLFNIVGCAIFAFSILASCAAWGYEEPVYTVTVANGTNSLDEAMVEVTQDGATTTAAFSSLTLDQGGTFVKKGMGWLQSSTAMSVFTGEVVVAEGALILTADGQSGATRSSNEKYCTDWTGCARLVVSNGATIVLITMADGTWIHLRQPVALAGEGLNGLGAIYHVKHYDKSSNDTQLYYSHVTLLDDAKIVYEDGGRVGIGYSIVDMDGHDLTFATRGSTRGVQVFCGLQVKNPGNILADHTQLYFSASKKWEGTAENTVTLTNNPYFRMYNFGGEIHWTLVNAYEGLIGYSQDSASSPSYDDPTQNIWHGPWRLDKSMYIGASTTASDNYGIVLASAVSGDGGFTLRHQWLRLKSKSNTFKGGVTVTTSGHLVLYGNGSLPADGGTLKLLNGGEVIFDEANTDALSLSTMEYPAIDWTVPSGETVSLPSCTNTVVKSLVKRGAGTLDISGKIAVTGVTEIAAGTLRVPFEQAGLCEGWVSTNGTGQSKGSSILSSLQYGATNRIASGTDLAYTHSTVLWQRSPMKPWSYLLSYHGYIWNRGTTDATWVIAQEMWKGTYLYIDGVRCKGYGVPGQTSGSEVNYYHGGSPNDNKRVTFYTVTVSPGPHRIDMRTYTTSSSFASSGYGPVCTMPTNATWKADFGWAIDWNGTMSTNCADYAEMRDPGDGSLFTVTTNGMDDVLSALVPKFDHLKFSGGTLDVRGSSLSVKTLECGAGLLTNSNAYAANGTLTVGEKLKVDGASYVGDTLKIQGRLKFAAGATIDGEGLSLLKHDDYVLVEATDGIEGMPAFGGSASGDRGWHLVKATVDGVETLTLGWRLGMTIIIK